MSRPVKLRKVEYDYQNKYFAPCSKGVCTPTEEVQLKVEELEAMRLKDIEGLMQEECARRMHISRQTFQNILDRARQKVTSALIQEKAISVKGGNYTKNICNFTCVSCGSQMITPFEEAKVCNSCGSSNISCHTFECINTCEKHEHVV